MEKVSEIKHPGMIACRSALQGCELPRYRSRLFVPAAREAEFPHGPINIHRPGTNKQLKLQLLDPWCVSSVRPIGDRNAMDIRVPRRAQASATFPIQPRVGLPGGWLYAGVGGCLWLPFSRILFLKVFFICSSARTSFGSLLLSSSRWHAIPSSEPTTWADSFD